MFKVEQGEHFRPPGPSWVGPTPMRHNKGGVRWCRGAPSYFSDETPPMVFIVLTNYCRSVTIVTKTKTTFFTRTIGQLHPKNKMTFGMQRSMCEKVANFKSLKVSKQITLK